MNGTEIEGVDVIQTLSNARAGIRLSTTQLLMLRGIGAFVALLLLVTTVGVLFARAGGEPTGSTYNTYKGTLVIQEINALQNSLDRASGELELLQLELSRSRAIIAFSTRYQIAADLAALIFDTALREGIDPDLAFRLVKVESDFNPRAFSSASAIGLAQVMVNTARFYQPGITAPQLFDPATNLTIGFRYLRDLLGTYQGNLRLALLAYNRGPARVNELLNSSIDPGNGYAQLVLRGYTPGNPMQSLGPLPDRLP